MAYKNLKDNLSQQRRYRDKHKALGLCTRCNNKAKEGYLLCDFHIDYAKSQNSKRLPEKSKEWGKTAREKVKSLVFNHYGNLCACCGETQKEFLTIDHVEGNGADQKKLGITGGGSTYRWLKVNNFPPGYRTLCFNCNISMGIYGYCPHRNLLPQKTKHPGNPFNDYKE